MRLLCWNCRGLGSSFTVRHGERLTQTLKPDFVFLSETHSKEKKAIQILSNWDFEQSLEVPRSGLSGGLVLGWSDNFQIQVIFQSINLIHVDTYDEKEDHCFITFLYGNPTLTKRNEVWQKLEQLGKDINGRWMCIGDFNQVLDFEDKLTFEDTGIQGSQELRSCLSNLSLLPIESKGLSYTRKNKRPGSEFVIEKLDKAFANWERCNAYPHCLVQNLPIMCLDHGPILLDTTWRPPFGQRPFRFEWMWTSHPDCFSIIQEAWNTNYQGSRAFELV